MPGRLPSLPLLQRPAKRHAVQPSLPLACAHRQGAGGQRLRQLPSREAPHPVPGVRRAGQRQASTGDKGAGRGEGGHRAFGHVRQRRGRRRRRNPAVGCAAVLPGRHALVMSSLTGCGTSPAGEGGPCPLASHPALSWAMQRLAGSAGCRDERPGGGAGRGRAHCGRAAAVQKGKPRHEAAAPHSLLLAAQGRLDCR